MNISTIDHQFRINSSGIAQGGDGGACVSNTYGVASIVHTGRGAPILPSHTVLGFYTLMVIAMNGLPPRVLKLGTFTELPCVLYLVVEECPFNLC